MAVLIGNTHGCSDSTSVRADIRVGLKRVAPIYGFNKKKNKKKTGQNQSFF